MKPLETIPETTWAYLAGLIDGEGTLSLRRRLDRPGNVELAVIPITNMNKDLVEYTHNLIDAGLIITVKHPDKIQASTFALQYHVAESKAVLPKVIPYLHLKKEMAKILLEALYVKQNYPHRSTVKKQRLTELETRFKEAALVARPWMRYYPYPKGLPKIKRIELLANEDPKMKQERIRVGLECWREADERSGKW